MTPFLVTRDQHQEQWLVVTTGPWGRVVAKCDSEEWAQDIAKALNTQFSDEDLAAESWLRAVDNQP